MDSILFYLLLIKFLIISQIIFGFSDKNLIIKSLKSQNT